MPPADRLHTGMTVGGSTFGDAGWATAVAPRGVGLYFGLLHEGRMGDNAARFGSRTGGYHFWNEASASNTYFQVTSAMWQHSGYGGLFLHNKNYAGQAWDDLGSLALRISSWNARSWIY